MYGNIILWNAFSILKFHMLFIIIVPHSVPFSFYNMSIFRHVQIDLQRIVRHDYLWTDSLPESVFHRVE